MMKKGFLVFVVFLALFGIFLSQVVQQGSVASITGAAGSTPLVSASSQECLQLAASIEAAFERVQNPSLPAAKIMAVGETPRIRAPTARTADAYYRYLNDMFGSDAIASAEIKKLYEAARADPKKLEEFLKRGDRILLVDEVTGGRAASLFKGSAEERARAISDLGTFDMVKTNGRVSTVDTGASASKYYLGEGVESVTFSVPKDMAKKYGIESTTDVVVKVSKESPLVSKTIFNSYAEQARIFDEFGKLGLEVPKVYAVAPTYMITEQIPGKTLDEALGTAKTVDYGKIRFAQDDLINAVGDAGYIIADATQEKNFMAYQKPNGEWAVVLIDAGKVKKMTPAQKALFEKTRKM